MKHLFLILTIALSTTTSSFADVNASDLDGFDLLSLAGTYSAENGDKVEVTVSPIENEQGELFGPSEYSVTAIVTIKGMNETYNIYELNTWNEFNFDLLPQKGQFILRSKIECEDPGCEWSETSLTFTKNKNGFVEVDYEFTYGAEVNEYYSDQNLPSIIELTDFCQETFGSITEGTMPYKTDLYCESYIQGTMK